MKPTNNVLIPLATKAKVGWGNIVYVVIVCILLFIEVYMSLTTKHKSQGITSIAGFIIYLPIALIAVCFAVAGFISSARRKDTVIGVIAIILFIATIVAFFFVI